MKPFTKFSSILFGIIALLNLMRLLKHFEVSILGDEMLLWVNAIGLVAAGILCFSLWKESKWKTRKMGKVVDDRYFFTDPYEADKYFNSMTSKKHIHQ